MCCWVCHLHSLRLFPACCPWPWDQSLIGEQKPSPQFSFHLCKTLVNVSKMQCNFVLPLPQDVYKVQPWSKLARGETENFPACHGFCSQLPPGYGMLLTCWKPNRPVPGVVFLSNYFKWSFPRLVSCDFLTFYSKANFPSSRERTQAFWFVIPCHSFRLLYLNSAVVNPSLILNYQEAFRRI